MHTFNFKSIGTQWWIEIYDLLPKELVNNLEQDIKDICNEFEKNYSRFKEDSFISILNKEKSLENFPEEMFEMMLFAKKANRLSYGNFNPAVAHILENIGYDKDYSFKKADEDLKVIDLNLAIEELSKDKIKINSNIKIDFGGFGKGWLIDKVSKFLKEKIKYFYINAGGDIYATSNFGNDIKFELENPFNLEEKIGEIYIKNSAIACSAVNRRVWTDKLTGNKFHHIINPNTGKFGFEIAAVFTQAEDALTADTSSTSIFIAKPEQIEGISENFKCEFMIVFEDSNYIKSPNYSGNLFK